MFFCTKDILYVTILNIWIFDWVVLDECAFFVIGDSMLWKARNFGDKELYHSAYNIKMPSCEQLQQLRNHG